MSEIAVPRSMTSKITAVDIAFAIALLGLSPLIWLQSLSLWSRPHLQFFPMAWAAFVYLTYQRSSLGNNPSAFRQFVATCIAGLAGVSAVGASLVSSPWLGYVAGVFVITAWMLYRLVEPKWTGVVALTTLLWITVPFPLGGDSSMIQLLQSISSLGASNVLDGLGVLHVREGNVIELQSKRLFVDEACSGVDSLYALMAICLGVVLWFRMPLIVGVLSLTLVPVWASCSNLIRLVSIALGLEWLNVDLSHGMPHTILGMTVFALAFLVDFAFINFIRYFLAPISRSKSPSRRLYNRIVSYPSPKSKSEKTETEETPHPFKSMKDTWHRLTHSGLTWASLASFGLVFAGVGVYMVWTLSNREFFRLPRFDTTILADLRSRQVMPPQLADSRLKNARTEERNEDTAFGQHSHVWEYESPEGQLIVSADFPFRGFHFLDFCYRSAGWEEITPVVTEEVAFDADWLPEKKQFCHMSLGEFVDTKGDYALLAFAVFQMDGKPVKSQANNVRAFERFEMTILEPVTFQVQVLHVSSAKPTNATKVRIKEAFIKACPQIVPSFANMSPTTID